MKKEVYFLFGCEVNSSGRSLMPWKALPLSHEGKEVTRWDEVRYLLELRINLHAPGVRRGGSAFISGMRRDRFKHVGGKWDPRHRLRANDSICAGEALVLFRRPLHKALAMYVPLLFTEAGASAAAADNRPLITFDEDADEETKMLAVLHQSDAAHCMATTRPGTKERKGRALNVHPCELEYTARDRPVPPESYVCRSCETSGDHFQPDCPRRIALVPKSNAVLVVPVAHDTQSNVAPDDSALEVALPLDMVKMAHGIPKMFLKAVDNVQAVSMLTLSGEAVSDERDRHGSSANAISQLVRDAAVGPTSDMFPPEPLTLEGVDDEELVFSCEAHFKVLDDLECKHTRALHKLAPNLKNKIPSICTHWINGLCVKGIACEYMHTYDPSSLPVCKFYMQGKCKNTECIFRHVTATDSATRVCGQYASGFCARGPRCDMQHVKRETPNRADFGPGADDQFKAFVKAVDAFRVEELRLEAMRKYKRPVCAIKKLASAQKRVKGIATEQLGEDVFF